LPCGDDTTPQLIASLVALVHLEIGYIQRTADDQLYQPQVLAQLVSLETLHMQVGWSSNWHP
jgi:hypothetical protein